jgi:Cell division protein CrgA
MARTRRARKVERPASGRYTPPQPKTKKHSALWVPAVMFSCLLVGVIVIIANYLEVLPGGQAQNSYLFLGLGLLVGGFVLSTQYR